MQFNSYIFILAFLPLTLILYFTVNRFSAFFGKLVLILAGGVYYACAGWDVFLIFLGSVLCNLAFSILLEKRKKNRGTGKGILAAAIIFNVLLLLYFKYFNFLLSNLNSLFQTAYSLQNLILPLGISFFTFQQIAWLVNLYRGKIPRMDIPDYLSYIFYFPKMIMGPITEPGDLLHQLNDPSRRKVCWENLACGIKMFSFGLFKKVILADTFAAAVGWGYANISSATSLDWFLVMLFYTFEIYFDFSGYIDMATGVSLMLNIELPANFNSPYQAISNRDFWKRWHMSLTGFFTQYVYIPLGGSRKGKVRTWRNTMIVFLVSGIWHGANWTYVLWGACNGLLSSLDRVFEKQQKKVLRPVRWFFTFFFLNLLFLLFRSDSIGQWGSILGRMFRFSDLSVSSGLIDAFRLPEQRIFGTLGSIWMPVFLLAAFLICLLPENNYKNRHKNNWGYLVLSVISLVWGLLALSGESVFVYFNF